MKVLGLLIVGVLAAISQSAAASVIFMSAATPQTTLQSWGQARQMQAMDDPFTAGPVQFGAGVTYRSNVAQSVVGYTGDYGFADKGRWSADPQSGDAAMAGLNATVGAMTFDFTTPVSSILAEMNWATGFSEGEPVFMSVFNAAGDLLESFELSSEFGEELGSGYFGFNRIDTDISRLVLSNGYIGARNFYTQEIVGGGGGGGGIAREDFARPVIQAPVPEPGTWALMLAGFGLAGATLRGARRQGAALA